MMIVSTARGNKRKEHALAKNLPIDNDMGRGTIAVSVVMNVYDDSKEQDSNLAVMFLTP